MDERTRRVGVNEAVFRAINERLEELNEAFATVTDTYDVVCECGDIGCVERFTMTPHEYRELRADPTLFAIRPDHEAPDTESVIADRGGYVIVRKREGSPARLAAETRDV